MVKMANADPIYSKAIFLEGLRKLCDKYNVVPIFDKIITRFRLGLQEHTNIYRKPVQGCMERGIRLNPWRGRNYMCAQSTDEDIEYTLKVIDEIMAEAVVEK